MRIEFHPAALRDLIASARFYESRLPGLGTDFKSELERSLELLKENRTLERSSNHPIDACFLAGFLSQ